MRKLRVLKRWTTGLFAMAMVVACGPAQRALAVMKSSFVDRVQELGKLVMPRVELYEAAFDSTSDPTSRELTQYAHYCAGDGRAGDKAESAIRKCFDSQIMHPKSEKFGTVLWRLNHPEINDPNAIEFTVHGLAPALVRYGDHLSPATRDYLKPHLVAAIAALRAHHVSVDYTNIYLMKATNLLLVGQYLNDPSAVSDGKRMLTAWLQSVRAHGITEYDSPTYACIVLNSLTPAHDLTSDPEAKGLLKTALDYTWADLAANYFSGQQTLCGAQSRNYSFTSSVNILCNNYYLEGLRDTPGPIGLFNEGPDTYINALESGESGYHPGEQIRRWRVCPRAKFSSASGPARGWTERRTSRPISPSARRAIGTANRIG